MNMDSTLSPAPVFGRTALGIFDANYPDGVARLTHNLTGHPLLSRDVLASVADALPPASVEYSLGDVPLGIRPEDAKANGLSLSDTIRTIGENGSWSVMKNLEQLPQYAELLDSALAQLERFVTPRTGPMLHRECFVFVTSPGSITPFHMDPEHNILLQIEGEKTMVAFPTHDEELVPAQQSEGFHLGAHRNLHWDDAFHAKATEVLIKPGEAVMMPVKAPHYVRNGDNISVSMSITWRSDRSVAEGELHALNARLRARHLPLVRVSRTPEKQAAARFGYRVARKIGL